MSLESIQRWYREYVSGDTPSSHRVAEVLGIPDLKLSPDTTIDHIAERYNRNVKEMVLLLKGCCRVQDPHERVLSSGLFHRLRSGHFEDFKNRGFAVVAPGYRGTFRCMSNRILPCLRATQESDTPDVFLVPGSTLTEYWRDVEILRILYREHARQKEYWKTALSYCLLDAYTLGANEVLVRIAAPCSYEFVADGDHYKGRLSAYVVQNFTERYYSQPEVVQREIFPLCGCRFVHIAGKSSGFVRVQFLRRSGLLDGSHRLRPSRLEKHILLIDDDTAFASLLSKSLEVTGIDVRAVSSVKDAMLFYLPDNGSSPDLVICDVEMPELDGEVLLAALRKDENAVPVLFLTSHHTAELEERLKRHGADAVVSKSIAPGALIQEVIGLIGEDA